MRPPPVPPSDRERQRSRSSSPLTSSKPAASSAKSTRLSPLKQVAFSDKVVLHSPTSTKNGSKSRFEDSKSDAKDDRDVKTTKSDVDESGVDELKSVQARKIVRLECTMAVLEAEVSHLSSTIADLEEQVLFA